MRLQQQQALAARQQQAQQAAQQLGMQGGGSQGGGKPVVGSSLPATDPHGLLALLRVRLGTGQGLGPGWVLGAVRIGARVGGPGHGQGEWE